MENVFGPAFLTGRCRSANRADKLRSDTAYWVSTTEDLKAGHHEEVRELTAKYQQFQEEITQGRQEMEVLIQSHAAHEEHMRLASENEQKLREELHLELQALD